MSSLKNIYSLMLSSKPREPLGLITAGTSFISNKLKAVLIIANHISTMLRRYFSLFFFYMHPTHITILFTLLMDGQTPGHSWLHNPHDGCLILPSFSVPFPLARCVLVCERARRQSWFYSKQFYSKQVWNLLYFPDVSTTPSLPFMI